MEATTNLMREFHALQDRVISKLEAMHAGIYNLQEPLQRQEKLISQLAEDFRQFRADSLAATGEEPNAAFIDVLQTTKKNFAASKEQFNALVNSIQAAQQSMNLALDTLSKGVKIQRLELQVAQLLEAANHPVAL
jgi:hypothetical protein